MVRIRLSFQIRIKKHRVLLGTWECIPPFRVLLGTCECIAPLGKEVSLTEQTEIADFSSDFLTPTCISNRYWLMH